MKIFIVALALFVFHAEASVLNCTYLGSKSSDSETKAQLDCEGHKKILYGSSIFIVCRPDRLLKNFISDLQEGEEIELELEESRVLNMDGSSSIATFIKKGLSASGLELRPSTFNRHGQQETCKDTQIILEE